ncbi:hypothetical protein CEXT_747561 [Caerostris extrusa]|uniref:Uncharacterized protein n=1 Tax=Caerostris extrusa TaxID=172846 RepID=A0AAV4T3D9_CAEEX|nr:hypothetical protein CEXT_747561 [Caerostris extrusa]
MDKVDFDALPSFKRSSQTALTMGHRLPTLQQLMKRSFWCEAEQRSVVNGMFWLEGGKAVRSSMPLGDDDLTHLDRWKARRLRASRKERISENAKGSTDF